MKRDSPPHGCAGEIKIHGPTTWDTSGEGAGSRPVRTQTTPEPSVKTWEEGEGGGGGTAVREGGMGRN